MARYWGVPLIVWGQVSRGAPEQAPAGIFSVVGCLGAEMDAESIQTLEQPVTDPTFRVYNIVEAVLLAANYDGVPGDECLVLLNPEHRLRKLILVETAGAGGSCALDAYSASTAFSFTWGDTAAYSGSPGITAIRAALSDAS